MTTPQAAIIPYAFVKPPEQYVQGEEIKERQRIKAGMRPIGTRTVLLDDMLTAADDTVLANTSGGDISLTLPRAEGSRNVEINILNIGAGVVTVVGTVSGVVSPTLAQWEGMTVVCDGTDYFQIGSTP